LIILNVTHVVSTKIFLFQAASDLYSPVSGEVVELNTEVQDKPQLVNKFCFEKGFSFLSNFSLLDILNIG